MMLPQLLSSSSAKAGAAVGALAVVQTAAQGTIEVGPAIYSGISVLLSLAGVYLARLVTIRDEDKALGRKQTYSETGPLTWIGVLIVCPLIWHYQVDLPLAGPIGLGVGYSVKVMLKIFGSGAVGAARAIARRTADALEDQSSPPPASPEPPPPPPPPPVTELRSQPAARPAAAYLPPDHDGPDGEARSRIIEQMDQLPPTPPKV